MIKSSSVNDSLDLILLLSVTSTILHIHQIGRIKGRDLRFVEL